MIQASAPDIILASGSATRRQLLAGAGIRFQAVTTGVDEDAVKREARILGSTPQDTALRLARLKAQAVPRPDALVIGCDQILVCDGIWYDKPVDLEAARVHLRALRGRPHALATAMVAVRGGEEVWRHATQPRLLMRAFTEPFLERYLAAEGDAVLSSVGGYRLEGLGVHLFEAIDGEHSAILGLPLLPLLGFLRSSAILLG
jgi:septum formation protein